MPDWPDYTRFTGRQNRDRDINELHGLIRGIALDGRIVPAEADALAAWCSRVRNYRDGGLYREACDLIREAISDGYLDEEGRSNILHYCELLRSTSPFYSLATANMQRLHGILAGIAADGTVVESEQLNNARVPGAPAGAAPNGPCHLRPDVARSAVARTAGRRAVAGRGATAGRRASTGRGATASWVVSGNVASELLF